MAACSNRVKVAWTRLLPSVDPKRGLPCARSSHGLSFLQGKIVLYGGEHVARTPIENEAGWILEQDEEKKWQWRKLPTTASSSPPSRVAHAQAVHGSTDVYIFGGRQGIDMAEKPLNDLWKLDIQTETWTLVEPDAESSNPPPQPRSFHKMICVGDDLFVFGGCGAGGRLADLHRFSVTEKKWYDLGESKLLRGRGGANLIALNSSSSLAVVAGFAGEETNDGHIYDLGAKAWKESLMEGLADLRPRSVCLSGSFPSLGVALIVGGEVDPSHIGHEGAGGFENDIVVLDSSTGALKETIAASGDEWPTVRGWSASDTDGKSSLYLFGGLTGDDSNPKRLDDLWRCDVTIST